MRTINAAMFYLNNEDSMAHVLSLSPVSYSLQSVYHPQECRYEEYVGHDPVVMSPVATAFASCETAFPFMSSLFSLLPEIFCYPC